MAEIRWYGQNCFRIRAKDATILTDPAGPPSGYALPRQTTADLVTISHEHAGHTNLDAIKPEFAVIRGPGEYEIHDVFVTGIRTYHDDQLGARDGYNTIYLYEVEGMTLCHLGDLGHTLSTEQAEAISGVDILFAPAGGGTLDPAKVAEIVARIEPKVVIPMRYKPGAGPDEPESLVPFVKHLGTPETEPEDKLTIRSSDLGETTRLVVLRPSQT